MAEDNDEKIENLRQLLQDLQEDDYEAVVKLTTDLLKDCDESLKTPLKEIQSRSYLHLEDWDAAAKSKEDSIKAYALYKKGELETVKNLESTDTVVRLLKAQACYNLHETTAARNIYNELIEESKASEDQDDLQDLQTNLVASCLSQATPFVGIEVPTLTDPTSYDLTLNVVTASSLSLKKPMWSLVEKAYQLGLDLEAEDDEQQEKELVPLQLNRQWSRSLWNGSIPTADDDMPLTSAQESIRQVHDALRTGKKYPEECPEKFTPLQQRLWHYNKAIWQLEKGLYKDAITTCDALWSTIHGSPKKKRGPMTVYNDDMGMLFWNVRIHVLKAYCLKNSDSSVADCGLDEVQVKIGELSESPARDHLSCYLTVHRSHLSDPKRPLEDVLTKDLPESIRHLPAVQASLANYYQQLGETSKAQDCMKATGDPQALAKFAMSVGDYEEAARLYGDAVKAAPDDQTLPACWVKALSNVEPDKAISEWDKIKGETDVTVDQAELKALGAELETRELPRSLGRKTATTPAFVTNTSLQEASDTTNKDKNKEKVLRRRARKREEYLATLEAKGLYRKDKPVAPDPERWIPKYDRAYNARRKRKNQRSAQGGTGSARDTARLDVVARQAAQASGELTSIFGPSTAHIQVTSSGTTRKKSGKKK